MTMMDDTDEEVPFNLGSLRVRCRSEHKPKIAQEFSRPLDLAIKLRSAAGILQPLHSLVVRNHALQLTEDDTTTTTITTGPTSSAGTVKTESVHDEANQGENPDAISSEINHDLSGVDGNVEGGTPVECTSDADDATKDRLEDAASPETIPLFDDGETTRDIDESKESIASCVVDVLEERGDVGDDSIEQPADVVNDPEIDAAVTSADKTEHDGIEDSEASDGIYFKGNGPLCAEATSYADFCHSEATSPHNPTSPSTDISGRISSDSGYHSNLDVEYLSKLDSADQTSVVECNIGRDQDAKQTLLDKSPKNQRNTASANSASPIFHSSILASAQVVSSLESANDDCNTKVESDLTSTQDTVRRNNETATLNNFVSRSVKEQKECDEIANLSMHTRPGMPQPSRPIQPQHAPEQGEIQIRSRGRSRNVQRNFSSEKLASNGSSVVGSQISLSGALLSSRSTHSAASSGDDTIISSISSRMRERSISRARGRSRSAQRHSGPVSEKRRPPTRRHSSRSRDCRSQRSVRSVAGEGCHSFDHLMRAQRLGSMRTNDYGISADACEPESRNGLYPGRGVTRSQSSCESPRKMLSKSNGSPEPQLVLEYDFDDGFDTQGHRQLGGRLSSDASVSSRRVRRSRSFQHPPLSVADDSLTRRRAEVSISSDCSVASTASRYKRNVKRSNSLGARQRRDDAASVASVASCSGRRPSFSSLLEGYLQKQQQKTTTKTGSQNQGASIVSAPLQSRDSMKKCHSLQPLTVRSSFSSEMLMNVEDDQQCVLGALKRTPSVYAKSKISTDNSRKKDSSSSFQSSCGLEVSPFSKCFESSAIRQPRRPVKKSKSLHVRRPPPASDKPQRSTPAAVDIQRSHSLRYLYQESSTEVKIEPPSKEPCTLRSSSTNDAVKSASENHLSGKSHGDVLGPKTEATSPSKCKSVVDTSTSSSMLSEDETSSTAVDSHDRNAVRRSFSGFSGSRLRLLVQRFKQ